MSFISPTLNAQSARLIGSMGSGTDLGRTMGSPLVSLVQLAGTVGTVATVKPTEGGLVRIMSIGPAAESGNLSVGPAALPASPGEANPRVWAETSCAKRSSPNASEANEKRFFVFKRVTA